MIASGTVAFTAMLDFQSTCSFAQLGAACLNKCRRQEDQDASIQEAATTDGEALFFAQAKSVLPLSGSNSTRFGRPSEVLENCIISESMKHSLTKPKAMEFPNSLGTSRREEGSESLVILYMNDKKQISFKYLKNIYPQFFFSKQLNSSSKTLH